MKKWRIFIFVAFSLLYLLLCRAIYISVFYSHIFSRESLCQPPAVKLLLTELTVSFILQLADLLSSMAFFLSIKRKIAKLPIASAKVQSINESLERVIKQVLYKDEEGTLCLAFFRFTKIKYNSYTEPYRLHRKNK